MRTIPSQLFARMLSAILTILFLVFAGGYSLRAEESHSLPRSTPEAEGISSSAIAKLVQTLDENIDTMNSLIIIRHGKVITECWWAPHTPDTTHALYSLTKSFTSTAIGFAVIEGKLSLDDKVIDFFPEDLPEEISENLKKMTVRDLLMMGGGHKVEAKRPTEGTWAKAFLAHPVIYEPGTHFLYNTPGSYMLSAILQKATGETTASWLQPRLFDPLGIEKPFWAESPDGVSIGGQGLFLHTEDIAKFGLFCLQKGNWNGKQLLDSSWFDEATYKQISNGIPSDTSDWNQGYGYQFWRCRHNIFRGDGAYGQFCVMIPEKDMVIASTADTNQLQDILDIYWSILLPAAGDTPLEENPTAVQELAKVEQNLTAKPGSSSSIVEKDQKIYSEILGRDVYYSVYLPKNYLTFGKNWPVTYLLHGLGDDWNAWINDYQGNLPAIADPYFLANPDQKMIFICPDAKATWYFNNADGKEQYEEFFFKEFIPQVEKRYRIASDRNHRTVAGLSMGGYGSLLWTLHHPEMFHAAYAISAAIFTDEKMETLDEKIYQDLYNGVYGSTHVGESRLTETYHKNSPIELTQNISEEEIGKIRYFLDCGYSDTLFLDGNLALFNLMHSKNIPVELRVRAGEHNWNYFRSALPTLFESLQPKNAD